MFDIEQQSTPDKDQFETILDEVENIQPDAPAEGTVAPAVPATIPAAPEAPAPSDAAPAESPATTEEVPPAGTPVETPTTETPAPGEPAPSWTFKVDGREVKLTGAREDGDNIVIPKATWNQEVKNYLADRGAIARREQQLVRQAKQVEEAKGQHETTSSQMMAELDRIMGLPEADSFDEWERFRSGYSERKVRAETEFWKNKATGQQQTTEQVELQKQMEEYVPYLQGNLRRFATEAVEHEKASGALAGLQLSPAEEKELAEALYERFNEDAEAGRVFVHTGELLPNTRLPKLDVNFERLRAVVDREVRVVSKSLSQAAALKKSLAAVEAAAKTNAVAEAKRTGGTLAPPALSGRPDTGAPVKAQAPKTFDDVLEEIDKI